LQVHPIFLDKAVNKLIEDEDTKEEIDKKKLAKRA